MSDAVPAESGRWRARLRYLPPVMLLVLLATADVAMALFVDPRNSWLGAIVLGLASAQVVLLAIWTALAPMAAWKRMVTGLCCTILLGLALVACIERITYQSDAGFWFAISIGQWCLIQIPLWVMRKAFDWRLCWPGEEYVASTRNAARFELRILLLSAALFVIALTIGRQLIPEELGTGRTHKEIAVTFSLPTLCNCLIAWSVAGAVSARRWWALWLLGATAGCAGLTVVETKIWLLLMERPVQGAFFWIANYVQAAAVAVALLVLRGSGFQLVRALDNSPST